MLTTAGCAAHARRPFALYEDDDPIYAPLMLDQFRQLAFHERTLDQVGRNRANVQAVRQGDSKPVWLFIREIAEKMARKWARTTPLGAAARYILKHFEKLTAYLQDVTLPASNNLRERLLRTEKLIQDSSLFRRTIEGRVVIDIIRTILQTAVAANVPVHEYLVAILKSHPDLAAAPTLFFRMPPHELPARGGLSPHAGSGPRDSALEGSRGDTGTHRPPPLRIGPQRLPCPGGARHTGCNDPSPWARREQAEGYGRGGVLHRVPQHGPLAKPSTLRGRAAGRRRAPQPGASGVKATACFMGSGRPFKAPPPCSRPRCLGEISRRGAGGPSQRTGYEAA